MTDFDPRLSVSAGLDHLAGRLDPIITDRLVADLGGLPWTTVLTQLDEIAGRPARRYSTTDLQAQLKMFTRRLGRLGFPFDDNRQTVGTLGRELTIVRNARAHGDPFTALDAWRAHDYCVRLLEHFADAEGLVPANEQRHAALLAYVVEAGVAPMPAGAAAEDTEPVTGTEDAEPEPVTPDPEVFDRAIDSGPPAPTTSVVGASRLAFEPWVPVPVGDVAVLDDLPKKAAKEKVRAVAAEIVEAEGPIHVDRLAALVAASFGVRRVYATRAKKIVYQARVSGIRIDDDKFAWPEGVDSETWTEFRPNDSETDRPFLHISPREIANARRFLQERSPEIGSADLDAATLRTFGRKRRTKAFADHLAAAS